MDNTSLASSDPTVSSDPPLDPSLHTRVTNPPKVSASIHYTSSEYHRMIAQAAYYLAEHRGLQSGHEIEDWLAAEREINRVLGVGEARNGEPS